MDRGSKDILVQKAGGVENILQLKAATPDFEETNLTVITADGRLYSYLLDYSAAPSALNLKFTSQVTSEHMALFPAETFNEAKLKENAKTIIGKSKTISGIKDKKYKMNLSLSALFIHNEVMYCQIKVKNSSNIDYDINQFRLFIRDRRKSKRTASQEIEIKPLLVQNNIATVAGQSEHTFVFALQKFTIPDKKYLIVQLMEKNGGRNLKLKISNKQLMKGARYH